MPDPIDDDFELNPTTGCLAWLNSCAQISLAAGDDSEESPISVTPCEARRLAAWLLRAADSIDSKEGADG